MKRYFLTLIPFILASCASGYDMYSFNGLKTPHYRTDQPAALGHTAQIHNKKIPNITPGSSAQLAQNNVMDHGLKPPMPPTGKVVYGDGYYSTTIGAGGFPLGGAATLGRVGRFGGGGGGGFRFGPAFPGGFYDDIPPEIEDSEAQ